MSLGSWRKHTDILLIREDDFSWQGSHPEDNRVFLRRLKNDPSELTDTLLGSLEDGEAEAMLTEFFRQTAGISSHRLRLSSIGKLDDDNETVASTFDRIVAIIRASLLSLGVTSTNAHLDQRGRKWDAVIECSVARKD